MKTIEVDGYRITVEKIDKDSKEIHTGSVVRSVGEDSIIFAITADRGKNDLEWYSRDNYLLGVEKIAPGYRTVFKATPEEVQMFKKIMGGV